MKYILPKNIISIISIIKKNGFTAHVVGGCVRDMILGIPPKDWDITTNALPAEIKALFDKTYDTGLKHGTVTVSYNSTLVEVTTWRTDTEYSDHRRPDKVVFTHSLTEDLARRDFTMNAIAYNPYDGLIDPYNGFDDIRRSIIRCVGDPDRRFGEDALRMLRALRFSAQLGFSIEEKTFSAIAEHSADLSYVSMERIQAEINKILQSPEPHKLSLIWETGMNQVVFSEIEALPSLWIDISVLFSTLDDKKAVLLALLFHLSSDISTDAAKKLLNRLKYDSNTLRGVLTLLAAFQGFRAFSSRNIRKSLSEYGFDVTKAAMIIINSLYGYSKLPSEINEMLNSPAHKPENPVLSGLDISKAGFTGRSIKSMLSVLSLCIYEKPELNDKDILLSFIHEVKNTGLISH